ncbi:HlyD family efflux transporter periplasmic adaptor subunit [Nitriliruptoraceae bacterium ZYF776]|nr:HlyD family efflux transporter periplasmic adaptor subunit [Profundirhabdus halotolerans]
MRRLSLLLVATLLVGCSGEPDPELGFAEVTDGEVVQTVAAAAALEPAAQVPVTAPLGGEVVELLVADGDEVERGDPLVRLASTTLDQQVAQAEAAVAAAEALAGTAGGAGFDLSPLLGSFRTQLDAVVPPLLSTLRGQLDTAERAAEQAATAAEEAAAAAEDAGAGDVELDVDAALADALAQVEDARDRLDDAESGYRRARGDLVQAEQEAAGSAQAAEAAQAAAVAAQREQAEQALAAVEDRTDDLLVEAPASGVVEFARGGEGGGGAPDLGALAEGGGLEGADLDGLLGGGGGGDAEPVAEGSSIAPGQVLLTIYDLSRFTAEVEVDEIDVVEVAVDQPVTVLVDAFPDVALRGVVDRVAIAPRTQPQGGAVYPVSVRLVDVPRDLVLRVGLTASAEVEVRRLDGETVVPTGALLRRSEDEVVFVVRDGVAREVPVQVLAIGEDTAAIAGALEVGERVVTTGVELVADGDELPG